MTKTHCVTAFLNMVNTPEFVEGFDTPISPERPQTMIQLKRRFNQQDGRAESDRFLPTFDRRRISMASGTSLREEFGDSAFKSPQDILVGESRVFAEQSALGGFAWRPNQLEATTGFRSE